MLLEFINTCLINWFSLQHVKNSYADQGTLEEGLDPSGLGWGGWGAFFLSVKNKHIILYL